jgi:uncharacterized LabA/DUF88 family protein
MVAAACPPQTWAYIPMIPKAVLFIDGSNFYHSLKKQECLPFDADSFSKLFEKLSVLYKIEKVYFYDAVKDSKRDPTGYSKQQGFHTRLLNSHPKIRIKTRKLRYLADIRDSKIKSSGRNAGITDSCLSKLRDFLTDMGLIKLTKEKGIDVQLVVDAIEEARKDENIKIIILSGDADFVPAVNLLKSYKVEVINLHPYSGSSTELRNACNKHILITFRNGEPSIK